MKALLRIAGLGALSASLFFGSILAAQAADQTPADNGVSMKMSDGSNNWQATLGLTDSQTKKFTRISKYQRDKIRKLNDLIQIDRDSLKLRLDFNDSGAALKPLLNKLYVEEEELTDRRESFKKQIKALLTPTQQAKLLLIRENHRGWANGDSTCDSCWGK